MDFNATLKKIFPVSYTKSLWNAVLYYVLAAIVSSLIIWLATALTAWLGVIGAIIGWILGIASTLVEIYVIAGIIVSILIKLDVLK